jgi:hypothetical protein
MAEMTIGGGAGSTRPGSFEGKVANGKTACVSAAASWDIVISPAILAEITTGGGASTIFSVMINFLEIGEISAFRVPSTSIALLVDDGLSFAFTIFVVFGGAIALALLN